MTNLLKETLEEMECAGKGIKDVDWIGSKDGKYVCNWEEFEKLANRKYDDAFGRLEVPLDLVVVFKDGSWLERWEEAGLEGWHYAKTPIKQVNPKKIKRLFLFEIDEWRGKSLEAINEGNLEE